MGQNKPHRGGFDFVAVRGQPGFVTARHRIATLHPAMPGKKKASKVRKTKAIDATQRQKRAKSTDRANLGKATGRITNAAPQPAPRSKTRSVPAARKTKSGCEPTSAMKTPSGPHDAAVQELRAFGLGYPESHTKSPWPDHLDLAVRDKTFAYLSLDGEPLSIGCKLPHSCQAALSLPFARPTPYGLGRSGWVTATFDPNDEPPVEFLKTWLDESYRAVAPKILVKKLPAAS